MSVAREPRMASPSTQDMGECPCQHPRCNVVGTKLTKFGCLVGCKEPVCEGRRSQRGGKRGHRRAHKLLGGQGWTPSNEESARPYHLGLTVMPEIKTGKQVNVTFGKFITSTWFRHALAQAEKAAPFGTGVVPAVVLQVPGSKQMWLVAKL